MISETTARAATLTAVVLACAIALGGCVPLVIGGAAVATAQIATDRRSTGAQLDDELIEDKTVAELLERYRGRDVHVNVTSYNGNALVTGEAPSETLKSDIGEIVRRMPKVRSVLNEMVVGPATDLGSRSKDTLITSKVKARFLEANRFQINHVKVVTERGVVYLMGVVRQDEADAAVDIARRTNGALRVVKVFEYVN
ncbi:MAG: BON domain-containing protein [Pseudomonadota bacterium]|nr:BON domain-containing protein [Pseudomonadota bacterium]